jgi:predicted RNA methylase
MDLGAIVLATWRKFGLKGVYAKATALMEDRWFDLRYGTDTSSKEKSVDPDVTSVTAVDGIRYAPTRARHFHALMNDLEFPHGSVFVDVGCGKGKVLIMAMAYPFKRVVGIEFSSRLSDMAKANVGRFCEKNALDNMAAIHHCDIVDYDIGPDENVFYLYNPFNDRVMKRFVEKIVESQKQDPRPIWMIYYSPIASCHRLVVNAKFELIKKMEYFGRNVAVYERHLSGDDDRRTRFGSFGRTIMLAEKAGSRAGTPAPPR